MGCMAYFLINRILFITRTYLGSTSGGRAPEGVHGGQILRLYGWRRASTGSAVGVAGEPLVHLPGGTKKERDTCSCQRVTAVTCSDIHGHVTKEELL